MFIKSNAISVDVEDYFQVTAFEKVIPRSDWSKYPSHVEKNTHRVLDIFQSYNIKGTFFTLGLVAESCPALIRRIVSEGHELASHGYDHSLVSSHRKETFHYDIRKSKSILEDIGGVEVIGYRAPSYSITHDCFWAYEILANLGFKYSSSIYPVKHDLYGIPEASRFPFSISTEFQILEIPISTVKFCGRNFQCGGGGFFRLYPYFLSKKLITQVNRFENHPCVFYFHPWEIDVSQPRIKGCGFKSTFRHYLNLSRMEKRLRNLLTDFSWDRIDNVYNVI